MVWFMQNFLLYSVYSHSCENPVLFITLRTCMNFFLLWNKTIFESGWKESVKLKTKNKKCVIKLHERNRPNLSVYRSVCVSNILRYIEYINNRVGVGEGAILYMFVGVCVCLGFAEAHIWPSSTFLSHWNRITHGSNDKRGQKIYIYIWKCWLIDVWLCVWQRVSDQCVWFPLSDWSSANVKDKKVTDIRLLLSHLPLVSWN